MPVGKKPAAAPAPKPAKARKAAKEQATPQVNKLRALVDQMNKAMGGAGRIDLGADIAWLDPPRKRTGILTLDVLSNGGYPGGACVMHWGPFSSCKTTGAVIAMAEAQHRGEDVLIASAEGPQKDWFRKCGLWIPYSAAEIKLAKEDVDRGKAPKLDPGLMEEYNDSGAGLGTVALIQHPHGDGLLEGVYRVAKQNAVSIVMVDSLAVLKNTRQIEDAEVGDEERGGGGQIQMINRFMVKCLSAFNTRYNAKGEVDLKGDIANTTTVICINQARQDQQAAGGPHRGHGGPSFKPAGGEGAKHDVHLSMEFKRGEQIGEKESLDGKQRWHVDAVGVNVRCDKSKVGPPFRTGGFQLDVTGDKMGTIDRAAQARMWGVYYEVIEQAGAWYELSSGERFNGKDALDEALREDIELRSRIEDEVIEKCRR